ncbi:MAG: Holliday junction resolvase RuvX [Bacteroidota bacterium]
MMRILAIDYGTKRTGLAWTDPLGMFATRLEPVDTRELLPTLERYVREGPVGRIILGWPTNFDGSPTHATPHVEAFHQQLLERFPGLEIELFDEQMTTKRARQAMLEGGASRKQRRDKHLINSLSAVILLQDYLEEHP